MKRGLFSIAAILCSIWLPAKATVIIVPDDYSTIQAGINAGVDGDTVLVQPGTYVENINFNGHNVVLGSLFLITGDTSYISSTIIDGDSYLSAVKFNHGETAEAAITGFTIQNGKASQGGGIFCHISSPTVKYNRIINNLAYGTTSLSGRGAGIYCLYSNPDITGNIIEDNACVNANYDTYGGGIFCIDSNPIITNNLICRNTSENAGGLSFSSSNPQVVGCTIADNTAQGINCNNSALEMLNSIIWTNQSESGHPEISIDTSSSAEISYCDILGGWEGEGNIDSNPLFVDLPNGDYNICSQSVCIDNGDPALQDPDGTRSDMGYFYPEHPDCFNGDMWHVSVSGDDTSGDGSESNPFRTVQHSLDVALHGDTIIVHNGTYVENVVFSGEILLLASEYYYSGDSLDIYNTVIDGNFETSTVIFEYAEDSMSVLSGFTIINGSASGICTREASPKIENNIITENYGAIGGGICCNFKACPLIRDNMIIGNSAVHGGPYSYPGCGGGINCYYASDATIIGNVIKDNSADRKAGGIMCQWGSHPVIEDNVIGGNSAGWEGGGVCFWSQSDVTMSYNVIEENSAEIGGAVYCVYGGPPMSYNVVVNNVASQDGGGIVCPGESSLNVWNNTIYGNVAGEYGGAIVCSSIDTLTNNILWANSAESSDQIYGSPVITYCDVQGGWEGQGNIECDPEFCDPDFGNFYLQETSCCLGAGEGGVDIGALGADCGSCYYIAGDCDRNGTPLELGDVIAMINMYRGTVGPYYVCDCPPHGSSFAATADPDGNCVPNELSDVVTEIAAYRGTTEPSGCPDCPGSRR
jgi:hypothetical protein